MPLKNLIGFDCSIIYFSHYRAGHDVEYQQGIENRNYDDRE